MSDAPPETPVDPEAPPVDDTPDPDPPIAAIQGQGGAVAELEALRERVALLEAGKSWKPAEPVRRMVPLWGAANDPYGRVPMVPYVAESLGDKLIRQQFEGENRLEIAKAAAIREMQAEEWRAAQPEPPAEPTTEPWSYSDRMKRAGQMIDTRSGAASQGPIVEPVEAQTHRWVDHVAAGFARLDKAEMLKKYREASETFGADEDAADDKE